MKNLRAATKRVLALVEERTGRPIQFLRNPDLKVMVTLRMARNGASYHVLHYRPTDTPLDYLIVHQAAFVLRLYENPPEHRFDFAPKDSVVSLMEELIRAGRPLAPNDAALAPQFAKFLAEWSLMNLRSLPVGMRIDTWIDAEVPDLRELQSATLAEQQQEYVSALSHRIGTLTIPRPCLGLVAAHAEHADRLSGTTKFSVPYRAAGLRSPADEILQCLADIDPAATHDTELIDRCAGLCGLANQYQWKPFKP